MKRGYLGHFQHFYLAGYSAGHRQNLLERGVAATDAAIPLEKMIYVAAFQGGIERFVTPLKNASLDPVDRFISARTLAPKQRDPQLLKKLLSLEPAWEKVETRHALQPLCFIYDLMVAMENRASLMYVSGIPKVEEVQRDLPADVAVPICTILSAMKGSDELLPAPSLTVSQHLVGKFRDLLNSGVYERYASAQERIEFDPRKSVLSDIRSRGSELLRFSEGLLDSRRVSVNIISVVPKIVDTAFGKLPGALAEFAGSLATKFMEDKKNVVIYQFDDWANAYLMSKSSHLYKQL